jgi:hypothetical protein
MAEVATDAQNSPKDIREVQLDYAWKWFEYHAAQRISMFNYFLAGSAILVGSLATLLASNLYAEALGVAILGFLVCVIFLGLDSRNKDLVTLGERILIVLEETWVFQHATPEFVNEHYFGILAVDAKLNKCPDLPKKRKFATHSKLIHLLQTIAALAFLVALGYSFTGHVCVLKQKSTVVGSEDAKDAYTRKVRACIYSSRPWKYIVPAS